MRTPQLLLLPGLLLLTAPAAAAARNATALNATGPMGTCGTDSAFQLLLLFSSYLFSLANVLPVLSLSLSLSLFLH